MSRIVKGSADEVRELKARPVHRSSAVDFQLPKFQIIRSDDLLSRDEAEELCNTEADKARQRAGMEVEARLKEPLKKGLENLESILDEISAFRRELFREAEEEVVTLIQKLAKKILGAELKSDTAHLLEIVQKGLMVTEKEKFIQLYIHPQDAEFFRSAKPDFIQKFHNISEIEIIEDANVDSGGVVLKTQTRQLDMTLDQMVDHLINRVQDAVRETKETGDEGDKVE